MSSTRLDVEVIGSAVNQRHRVAASATRFYAGEPLNGVVTYSSGVAATNTISQAADGTPVIGTATTFFAGIAAEDAPVGTDTTVDASWVDVSEPIAGFTKMRAKAKTTANADSESELIGLLYDLVLWDLTASVFTIDETATADTSGLQIRGGIWETGHLDVIADPRAMRTDVA